MMNISIEEYVEFYNLHGMELYVNQNKSGVYFVVISKDINVVKNSFISRYDLKLFLMSFLKGVIFSE